MTKKKLIEDIVREPLRFHRAPVDVMRDRRFNDEERREILTAWERRIREQDGESETQRMQLVIDARQELERRARPVGAQGA
ncbi:MAG: hypothetical protein WDM86_08970 [Rhizomicrobium sp.]